MYYIINNIVYTSVLTQNWCVNNMNITCEINWISEIWNGSCKNRIIQALLVPKIEKEIKIAEFVEIISSFLLICWLYVTWMCVYKYRMWQTSLISFFLIFWFVKSSQHTNYNCCVLSQTERSISCWWIGFCSLGWICLTDVYKQSSLLTERVRCFTNERHVDLKKN